MSFDLHHVLVSRSIKPVKRMAGEESFFRVAAEGDFAVRYPGKITRRLAASFDYKIKVDEPIGEEIEGGGGSQPLHGGWQTAHKTIPLTLRIFDPDNVEFTADSITLADLRKHRDLRGTPRIPWRVYESFPSVTMLRFFARYATDNINIVPIDRFAQDVANGDLPPFVAIEPSMHHHPPNDDHPPADMHRGQIFLKKVYDTLRSNPAIWQRTLLVITYDEHGGLYDHAIPPVADLLRRPLGGVLGDRLGTRVVVAERELAEVGGGSGAPGGGGGGLGGRIVDVIGGLDHVLVRDGGAGGTPPERPPEEPASMAIPYGVRVPTFLVSPWTMPGKGESRVLDHCSILKTVLARFAGGTKPFLSDRVAASQTFEAYLTAPQPRMDVPDAEPLQDLPLEVPRLVSGASAIATPPLSRTQMRAGPVEFHELGGRLARMLGR